MLTLGKLDEGCMGTLSTVLVNFPTGLKLFPNRRFQERSKLTKYFKNTDNQNDIINNINLGIETILSSHVVMKCDILYILINFHSQILKYKSIKLPSKSRPTP